MTKYLDFYSRFIAYAVVLYLLIGDRPFYQPEDGIAIAFQGNARRQVTWMALFILTLPVGFLHRQRLIQLFRDLYLLWIAVAICWASVLWAISPDISLRRVILLTLTLYILTAVTIAHRSTDDWIRMLTVCSGVVMLINWFGVLFLPGLSITELGWSGMYSHKNVAGGLTAIIVLWWLFAAMNSRGPLAAAILYAGAVLWFMFLIGTQSKTSITFCLICGSVGLLIEFAARRGHQAFLLMSTMMAAGLVWVATMIVWLSPRRFLIMTFGDPTLTGRTGIWEFMVRQIQEAPLIGHGYGSFWLIGDRSPVVRDGRGWFTGTTQGHNGYLDLAATIGIVGTAIFVSAVLLCLWRIGRMVSRHNLGEEGRYAGLLAALIVFALLHNMLESTFLRGSHIVWVSAYMSMVVITLSLAGRLRPTPADPPIQRQPAPYPHLPSAGY